MIYEPLEEDEMMLYALLMDESGIDQAEFALVDDSKMEPVLDDEGNQIYDDEGKKKMEKGDGIFRCWPFQYPWFRDTSKRQIDSAARSVGKSMSIKLRALAFPFIHPGEEMVITAPGDNHLTLVTDNVESLYSNCRLAKEMLVKSGKGTGAITHKPFKVNFAGSNGRIVGRIPHQDGKNIKGSLKSGSLILTRDRGLIEIQNATTDDYVFTHRGVWQRVLSTYSTNPEQSFKVRGQGSFGFNVNEDHRFWIREDESSNPGKKAVKLGEPYWQYVTSLKECKNVKVNAYWTSATDFGEPLPVPEIDYSRCRTSFDMDEDFWWLVGRYAADGSIAGGNDGKGYIQITADQVNIPDISAHITPMGASFTIKDKDSSAKDVCIYNAALAKWLYEHIGHHSHHKTVPTWIITLEEKFRRAFFDGYTSGDGCEFWSGTQMKITGGSASKRLALGVSIVAQTLGFHIGLSRSEIKHDHVMGVPLKKKAADSWRFGFNRKGKGKLDRKGYVSYKIRDVTPDGICPHYGVSTEDGSYWAEGVFHHNTHPLWLEMDEASDYPPAGWVEIGETVKRDNPLSRWRAHGVTRGFGDDFDKKISGKDDKTWRVHRLPATIRPEWTDADREYQMNYYEDPIDFDRNVLGRPGDQHSPMFSLSKIMANVDQRENSKYNSEEYFNINITDHLLREYSHISELLDFPPSHKENYQNFWIGMDCGWTQSPSAITVFAEVKKPKSELTSLKLLSKVLLTRIDPTEQRDAVMEFMEFYRPQAFAVDATGAGFVLHSFLKEAAAKDESLSYMLKRIKDYNFQQKIVVGFNEDIEINEFDPDSWKEAAIKQDFLVASTDAIRVLLDSKRLPLPLDYEVISEFQGVPKNLKKQKMDEYGRQGKRKSGMHTLDAIRMAVLAHSQNVMDRTIAQHEEIWEAPEMIVF